MLKSISLSDIFIGAGNGTEMDARRGGNGEVRGVRWVFPRLQRPLKPIIQV
jgi:hypothetical protein